MALFGPNTSSCDWRTSSRIWQMRTYPVYFIRTYPIWVVQQYQVQYSIAFVTYSSSNTAVYTHVCTVSLFPSYIKGRWIESQSASDTGPPGRRPVGPPQRPQGRLWTRPFTTTCWHSQKPFSWLEIDVSSPPQQTHNEWYCNAWHGQLGMSPRPSNADDMYHGMCCLSSSTTSVDFLVYTWIQNTVKNEINNNSSYNCWEGLLLYIVVALVGAIRCEPTRKERTEVSSR